MTHSHCYTNYDNVVNISGQNIMIFVYTYKQSQKITEINFTHKMYKCIFLLFYCQSTEPSTVPKCCPSMEVAIPQLKSGAYVYL